MPASGFTSIGEGIDTQSATGRLMLGILGSFAEFERARIVERVRAGIARARSDGKRLGRRPHAIVEADLNRVAHLSQREAAAVLQIPRSVLQRARVARNPSALTPTFAPDWPAVLEPGPVAR